MPQIKIGFDRIPIPTSKSFVPLYDIVKGVPLRDSNGNKIPKGTAYIKREQRRKYNCLSNEGLWTPYTNCVSSGFDNVESENFSTVEGFESVKSNKSCDRNVVYHADGTISFQ